MYINSAGFFYSRHKIAEIPYFFPPKTKLHFYLSIFSEYSTGKSVCLLKFQFYEWLTPEEASYGTH